VKLSGSASEPGAVRQGAPRLGEHTREILAEAGLDGGEIAALIHGGVALAP
jgi:crotonobetainyl-CoA:carnitine CoA-transferase CaiB-like acyl-CoA transferase